MSSDDSRISTEELLALAEPVHVDTLTRWESDPYAGDVGQRALQSETFGQLDVVYIYGTEVLYGQDLVEAQRHQPDDDGFVPAVDLAKAGYSRIKAEAAADAKWAIHRDSSVDSVLLAEMRTRIIQEDEAIALAVGYDGDDLDALIEQIEQDQHNVGLNDPDEVPDVPTSEPVTKTGDVWLLGQHRLICGDCTDPDTVKQAMGGDTAEMIHADPPYGMGKEKDGIANDNLYGPKLDAFQMDWWQACRPHVQDNGSAYIWGNAEDLWRLWYVGGLKDSERLSFRSEVVWDKSSGQGMESEQHRMFPTATERCLFLMFGAQEQSTNADEYWEGWEPVRAYLDGERERLGLSTEQVGDALGFAGGRIVRHWFYKSQWSMPTRENYESLQSLAQGDAFKREYDDIHAEWLAQRAPFDNTHDNMTDVWDFPRVTGDDRHGHATPKPVDLVARAIKSSSTPGGHVLVPFAGTLPEIIACEQTGRVCHAIELSPHYCDVIAERYERHTGVKPIREATGEPVSFMDGDD